MPTLNLARSSRASQALTSARSFTFTAPADCYVSLGPSADVVLGDCRFARLNAGATYTFTTSPTDLVLSGITTDARGDTTPTTLTFADVGAAGAGAAPVLQAAAVVAEKGG